MTEPFLSAREARNTARSRFDSRLAKVRGKLAERGVKGRVADKLGADAKAAAMLGLDVARESKGIIAATVSALALWSLRKPIIDWLEERLTTPPSPDEDTLHD